MAVIASMVDVATATAEAQPPVAAQPADEPTWTGAIDIGATLYLTAPVLHGSVEVSRFVTQEIAIGPLVRVDYLKRTIHDDFDDVAPTIQRWWLVHLGGKVLFVPDPAWFIGASAGVIVKDLDPRGSFFTFHVGAVGRTRGACCRPSIAANLGFIVADDATIPAAGLALGVRFW
ncbi:MAG: hypothetical protein AB7R00_21375 [Kofleriaceae bacterium]